MICDWSVRVQGSWQLTGPKLTPSCLWLFLGVAALYGEIDQYCIWVIKYSFVYAYIMQTSGESNLVMTALNVATSVEGK